jgi:hypothetical protein
MARAEGSARLQPCSECAALFLRVAWPTEPPNRDLLKQTAFVDSDPPAQRNKMHQILADLVHFIWLGRRDSNPRMPVPKTGALPLGDALLTCQRTDVDS